MTQIQWADKSWNPTVGCSKVSEGCRNCYAMKQAKRNVLCARGQDRRSVYEDVVEFDDAGDPLPRWNRTASFLPGRLEDPVRRKKPTRWFVDSMSDLFHKGITFEQIAAIFGVMAQTPRHTYQVLTKRPQRASDFFQWVKNELYASYKPVDLLEHFLFCASTDLDREQFRQDATDVWPLPNVWLGVSAENQQAADERVPRLLDCPAAIRFVSAEPLLGPIDFRRIDDPLDMGVRDVLRGVVSSRVGGLDRLKRGYSSLDWIIAGGESGAAARDCDVGWVTDIVRQCKEAGVSVFVKQLGDYPVDNQWTDVDLEGIEYDEQWPTDIDYRRQIHLEAPKGKDPSEWPEELQIRQFPEVE